MPNIGPVRLSVEGDTYAQPCRIAGTIWEGEGEPGDTAEVSDAKLGIRLWRGRARDTQNDLPWTAPRDGVHAPNGFTLSQISSGEVYVYLAEN